MKVRVIFHNEKIMTFENVRNITDLDDFILIIYGDKIVSQQTYNKESVDWIEVII